MKTQWLLILILCCSALVACQREDPASNVPVPGPAAEPDAQDDPGGEDESAMPDIPALRVTTTNGDAYDLADHRGKWVVVNFWATWCAPCREEMPELSALGAMRQHIEVIGLAYEEIELEAMRAFLDEYPVTYPVAIVDVYDPPVDFDTPRGLPMTYVIAPDGTVARKFLGPITAHDIETAIAEAGGPQVPDVPVEPAA